MTCEQFRSLAVERALGQLDGEALIAFEAHRTSCDACNTRLQRANQLLDSIDRGVSEMVDVQPSADFAVQLRQRLSESSLGRQEFFPRSWFPVVAGTLALLTLTVLYTDRSARRRDSNSLQEPAHLAVNSPASSPPAVPEPGAAYEDSMNRARRLKFKTRRRQSPRPVGGLAMPVIVPPGQWTALATLAADASKGRISVDPIKLVAVGNVEPAEVAPSALSIFEIVSVPHRDALGDDQNE